MVTVGVPPMVMLGNLMVVASNAKNANCEEPTHKDHYNAYVILVNDGNKLRFLASRLEESRRTSSQRRKIALLVEII